MSELLRPLGDRVLVRRAPEDCVTRGGLVLPDQAKEKPRRGTVLALGVGRKIEEPQAVRYPQGGPLATMTMTHAPFQVQVGDVVYFNRYGGREVEHVGETLLLISETEILAYTRD